MTPLHVRSGRLLTHQLSRQAFEELCSGGVTEQFVAAVAASQYSSRKLLLRGLADFCTGHPESVGPLTRLDQVWDVLVAAEERDPAQIREILLHPTVGVWLARILKKVHGQEADSIPVWSDLGYVHSLSAAAAIRTAVPFEIRLPVVHGVVTLPGIGYVELPTSFPAGFAVVRHSGTTTEVISPRGHEITFDSPHFFPIRRHTTVSRGLTLDVEINDSDPYRELSAPVAPRRLDPARFAEWRKMLDEAFDALTLWHPDYARELASGLRMVTPLPADTAVRGASSSVAIGCVAVSEKASATTLAETLVHEFQHSKLNGLLSLFDLGARDNLYAPWRDDPRPLSGVLHGILAFASVAEFWQVQRDLVADHEARTANFTFAVRRAQVSEAIAALRDEPALTRLGRVLLDSIHTRFARLEHHSVAADVADAVKKITDDHRATWRSCHVRPDPDDITRLANAWMAGVPPTHVPLTRVHPNNQPPRQSTRLDLIQLRTTDPDAYREVLRTSSCTPGDAAYLAGDYVTATHAYLKRLREIPDDADSWVGLGLSLQARGNPCAAAILREPATIIALYNRILSRAGAAPDPIALAGWIGAGQPPAPIHSRQL